MGTVIAMTGVAAEAVDESGHVFGILVTGIAQALANIGSNGGNSNNNNARDLSISDDPYHPANMIHYYPRSETGTTVQQLKRVYNGSKLLVSRSKCEGDGCFDYHYHNDKRFEDDDSPYTIHTITRSPRLLKKRCDVPGCNLEPQVLADFDDSSTPDPAGDVLHSTYSFWDIRSAEVDGLSKRNFISVHDNVNIYQNFPAEPKYNPILCLISSLCTLPS